MEIRNYITNEVIVSGDEPSILELLQRAVKEKKNLDRANLTGANLTGANLTGANLTGANLTGAILYGANLYGANLTGANLDRARLTGAILYGANLYGANLTGANLDRARLTGANLTGAILYGANLYGANLYGANLDRARLPNYSIVPECGQFTVFKKVRCGDGCSFIAELIVPANAKRVSSLVGRKCRVSAARVIDVRRCDGQPTTETQFFSSHDPSFKYRIGDLVELIEPFSDDIRIECASGIHCFITRDEAVNY